MSRYAVIRLATGMVENVIEWDGLTTWTPPKGCEVRLSNNAGPGDTWNGVDYIRPFTPPVVDEKAAFAAATAAEKLQILAQKVGLA